MSLILNILNFVLGGFAVTLGWLFSTIASAVLIITLPYTRSCWEITKMSLVPFGNDIVHVKYLEPTDQVMNSLGSILNIIWFILFGWWLCLLHITSGIAQCITIIGIPVGIAQFKLAGIALFPVGQRVVPSDLAKQIRKEAAQKQFNNLKNS
ncbi:YccF domain-containing protein [Seminibacterium arietis]|uniref:Inner membrane protein YccF n=1 Tax=Seminibacterium arietis TaxID=1173502 RepID=A0ABW3I7E6_9PAST